MKGSYGICVYKCVHVLFALLYIFTSFSQTNQLLDMTYQLDDIKSAKGISVVHINARSLLPHFNEIDCQFLDGYIDVLVVTESWLHKNVGDALISSNLYDLYRLDRQVLTASGHVKQGGGICVYTRHGIEVMTSHLVSNGDIELLTLVLKIGNHKKIKLCAVYRPPSGNCDKALINLREVLDAVDLETSGNTVLLGDLNINLGNPSTYQAKKLTSFAESKLLHQLIYDYTRVTPTTNSLIDHIFTNAMHVSLAGTIDVNTSDHFPIFVILKKARCKKVFKEIQGRKYKSADLTDFEEDIRDPIKLFSSGDPNKIWETLFRHIMQTVDDHFPITTLKIPISRPFYLDDRLVGLMRQRDVAFHHARHDPSPAAWALARQFRSRISREIRIARKNYICSQLVAPNGDSRKFWHTINDSFLKTKPTPITQINDELTGQTLSGKPAADLVNRYFCEISSKLAKKFDNQPEYDIVESCESSFSRQILVGQRRVEKLVKEIDCAKASGFRLLPTKLLKSALLSLIPIFTYTCLSRGVEIGHGDMYTQER